MLKRYFMQPLQIAADLIRIGTRCAFPFSSVAVLALVLLVLDQGPDIMRIVAESWKDGSTNDALWLLFGVLLLSLSVWYSMRWLLSAEFRTVPLAPERWSRTRVWAPRIMGAIPPGIVAYVYYSQIAENAACKMLAWIFLGLTVALLLFFRSRGWLMKKLLPQHSAGRDARTYAPANLPLATRLPPITTAILGWALAVSFLFVLLFTLFPVNAPRVLGAAALATIALASINLFGSFILTFIPLRSGLPPLWPLLLLWAVLISPYNDNHKVREIAAATSVPADEWRLPVVQAWQDWLQQNEHCDKERLPVFVVATEGGGIRAAYWTAAVLQQLSDEAGVGEAFRSHLFAISAVSGGSLGAAAYVTSAHGSPVRCPQKNANCAPLRATHALGADFLSPAVAGLLFQDLVQRFVPFPVAGFDRSRALEEGWAQAFSIWPNNLFEKTMQQVYADRDRLPLLLLNTTVVESGKRAIMSSIKPDSFNDVVDVMRQPLSTNRQSLAGLVHNSARFPVISPAGTVGDGEQARHRVIDGGYFDNSGAATALELIRELAATTSAGSCSAKIVPVLLILRNDINAAPICAPAPESNSPKQEPAPLRLLHEVGSPILGLYNARSAHARLAAVTAAREVEHKLSGHVFEFAPAGEVAKTEGLASAPLGWALSAAAREGLDGQAIAQVKRQGRELRAVLQGSTAEVRKCLPLEAVTK